MDYFKPLCHHCTLRVDCLIVGRKRCPPAKGYGILTWLGTPLITIAIILCFWSAYLHFRDNRLWWMLLNVIAGACNTLSVRSLMKSRKSYRQLVQDLHMHPSFWGRNSDNDSTTVS